MRRCLLLLWCCVLVSLMAFGQSPKITRGPYLQMAFASNSNQFSPNASITIRWSTDVENIGRVAYSEEPEYELLGGVVGTPFVEEAVATKDHKVTLTNLKTDHQYRYYIGTAFAPATGALILEKSPDHFFRTPPPPDVKKKTKMWVLGDFGAFPPNDFNNRQDSTIAAFRDFMTQNNTGPMDLWLWLGDNAYDGGNDFEFQNYIFDKTRSRYDWIFRQTPFYPIPGNHEYQYQPPLEQNRLTHDIDYFRIVSTFQNGEGGGEPSGKKEYYSFNYSNIHIIGLDSYGYEKAGDTYNNILSSSSVQYQWLERDLKKAQADPNINWIIVMLHHPPYTGGTHNSDQTSQPDVELGALRQNLVPLLDKYKVDLVLSGHSHGYERSRLMKKHTGFSSTFLKEVNTPALGSNAQGSGRYDGTANNCFYYKTSAATENEGIVYVVNGGGGRAQEFVTNSSLISNLMASSSIKGGSMYLEVDNKKLTAKFISVNKQVLDQFTIFKDLDGFTIPQTDGTTRTAICECTDPFTDKNSFTHYVDDKGNLLLSINKNGNEIGKAGVSPFEVKLGGGVGKTNVGANYPSNYVQSDRTRTLSSGWRVMNRYWTVKPTTELTGNNQVIVRHYYKDSDISYLASNNSIYEALGHYSLRFFKINSGSSSVNIDPASGIHNTLKGAVKYNENGIWLFDGWGGGNIDYQQASISGFKWRNGFSEEKINFYPPYSSGNSSYSGEFVVGRLTGGGGIGGQLYNLNPRNTTIALHAGSIWRYYATGQTPPDIAGFNWKGGQDKVDSDDNYETYDTYAKGRSGAAPLGYSPDRVDGEKTKLPACQSELDCYVYNGTNSYIKEGCPTCVDRWPTLYFRNIFSVNSQDYSSAKSIIINYKRDDGLLLYINGKEVTPREENMVKPEGFIFTFNSFANTAGVENEWYTLIIPNNGTYVRPGFNTIAVELHQNSSTSSDAHFDMEIILSPDAPPSNGRLPAQEVPKRSESLTILYPNPTENGKVYFTETIPYETIRVVDTRGVVIRYISEPGLLNELDVSTLPVGTFILSAQNKNQVNHFKIVKKD